MTSNFPKLNLLCAYPYFKQPVIEVMKSRTFQENTNVLVDSGAFTAWKAGKPIRLQDYLRFLDSLPYQPFGYFMLDVIGQPDQTRANYSQMYELGYRPIPIFTRGEDFDELENYYERTDYVGVGGLVKTPGAQGFVKRIMQKINGRKVHLLGFTNQVLLKATRPYSVDASSWSAALTYARLAIYVGNGRWISLGKKDFQKQPKPEVLAALSRYDVDYLDLAKQKNWRNSGKGDVAIEHLTFRSFIRYATDIERAIGTKYFLAIASDWQAKLALDAYLWAKEKYGGST
jgi:hypothetical protein